MQAMYPAGAFSIRLGPAAWDELDEPQSLCFEFGAASAQDAEQFQMAVVAADIHLEIQTKAMLEIALKCRAPDLADVLMQTPGLPASDGHKDRYSFSASGIQGTLHETQCDCP